MAGTSAGAKKGWAVRKNSKRGSTGLKAAPGMVTHKASTRIRIKGAVDAHLGRGGVKKKPMTNQEFKLARKYGMW